MNYRLVCKAPTVDFRIVKKPINHLSASLKSINELSASLQRVKKKPEIGNYNRRHSCMGNDGAKYPFPGNFSTDVVKNEGIKVIKSEEEGRRVITESVGNQVLGEFVEPKVGMTVPSAVLSRDAVTIGEALEAAAKSAAGDKPVTQSDAAAITAAEMRASQMNQTPSSGVGARAQSAANWNTRIADQGAKKTIRNVLGDAKGQLVGDKPATKEDAEAVVSAEIRNTPYMTTTPGGVAESVTTAARVNQDKISNYPETV